VSAKVLVADDSAFMRMTVSTILQKCGFEIVGEAESGEEAIEKYKQLSPDVVSLDLVMAGSGGIDAVKGMIAHDPNARILMVSALGQEALIFDAIQAGALGFVIKPFEDEYLVSEVRRVLRAKKEQTVTSSHDKHRTPALEDAKEKKVLVVDDSDNARLLIRTILKKIGVKEVEEARTGEEAIRKYRETKPDLITMDVVMPGVGGIKATREILFSDPDARVLVVTAMGHQDLLFESIQDGVEGFVIKPFEPDHLAEELKRILGDNGDGPAR